MRKSVGLSLSVALVSMLAIGRAHAGPVFGAPVFIFGSAGATEPGVDVGPDGTVFVNGPTGIGGHSKLWRSTNGAASFTQTAFGNPNNRWPGGGDSDVVVGDHGRVYFLDLWGGSDSLLRSDDNGVTWAWGTPLTTLPTSDRQWIELGGPGTNPGDDTVYIVYHQLSLSGKVLFTRSKDSGVTWTTHELAPSPVQGFQFTGNAVSDRAGYVGFDWAGGSALSYSYSTDDGDHWTTTQVATGVDGGVIPSVALDGQNVYATWLNAADHSVKVAQSNDRGATFADPVTVSAGGTNIFSWIAARNGKAAVTWYGTDSAEPSDPNTESGPWYLRYAEATNGTTEFTAPVNAAPAAVKNDPVCTHGVSCTSGRQLGDFLEIAIDNDGASLISYVDVAGGRAVNVVKQSL